MNKNILWLLGILVSLSAGFTSCSEDTQTADPYSDWAVRNDAYIDSIASVCANPPAGDIFFFQLFNACSLINTILYLKFANIVLLLSTNS